MFEKQIALSACGVNGQAKLQNAKVLVVGVGGLGSAVAMNLGGMGIGKLTLIDPDEVHLSNLHRQYCFAQQDIQQPKVQVTKIFLEARNPSLQVDSLHEALHLQNVEQLVEAHDVVVDCTDNAYAKYVLDEACFKFQKPLIYGAVGGFEGYVSVFHHQKGYRFTHLYPNKEALLATDSCNQSGVFGFLCSLVGSLQSAEVFKIITHQTGILEGELLIIDALTTEFRKFKLKQ